MKIKRIIMLAILFLMFVPLVAKAETCKIVKGDGKSIGDEVKCGSESFYVIESGAKETKLLAKYNLLVGDKISYIETRDDYPRFSFSVYNDYKSYMDDLADYCSNLAADDFNPYYVYPMADYDGENKPYLVGCRIYEKIEYKHALQDKKAVGTFLVNGVSKLPLYGITYMNPEWGYEAMHDGKSFQNVYDDNGNLIIAGSTFEGYLKDYKTELKSQNIDVEDVSLLTLNQTLNILKKISGKDIEVALVYPDNSEVSSDEEYHTGKMDIKEYITKDYSWFYDRTYWVGSGFTLEQGDPNNIQYGQYNDYYISNEGYLCALGRGECAYLPFPIGNGLRPVITVLNTNMEVAGATSEDTKTEEKKEKNPNTDTGIILYTITIIMMFTSACYIIYYNKMKKAKVTNE